MERCKVFEIRLGLNRGRTRIKLRSNYDEIIINLIIIKNIIKYIKLLKIEKKKTKIVQTNIEIYLSNVFFIS